MSRRIDEEIVRLSGYIYGKLYSKFATGVTTWLFKQLLFIWWETMPIGLKLASAYEVELLTLFNLKWDEKQVYIQLGVRCQVVCLFLFFFFT